MKKKTTKICGKNTNHSQTKLDENKEDQDHMANISFKKMKKCLQ